MLNYIQGQKKKKNHEMYNNKRKEMRLSKFHIEAVRNEATDSKKQRASDRYQVANSE